MHTTRIASKTSNQSWHFDTFWVYLKNVWKELTILSSPLPLSLGETQSPAHIGWTNPLLHGRRGLPENPILWSNWQSSTNPACGSGTCAKFKLMVFILWETRYERRARFVAHECYNRIIRLLRMDFDGFSKLSPVQLWRYLYTVALMVWWCMLQA